MWFGDTCVDRQTDRQTWSSQHFATVSGVQWKNNSSEVMHLLKTKGAWSVPRESEKAMSPSYRSAPTLSPNEIVVKWNWTRGMTI